MTNLSQLLDIGVQLVVVVLLPLGVGLICNLLFKLIGVLDALNVKSLEDRKESENHFNLLVAQMEAQNQRLLDLIHSCTERDHELLKEMRDLLMIQRGSGK